MGFERGEKIAVIVLIVAIFIVAGALALYLVFVQNPAAGPGNQASGLDDESSFRTALEQGNPRICNSIGSQSLKTQCLQLVGNPQNIQVDEQALKDAQYFQEAISSGDSSVCESIANAGMKEQCKDLGLNKNTGGIVLTPEQQNDRETLERAIAEGNPSYCDLINDANMKSTCKGALGSG